MNKEIQLSFWNYVKSGILGKEAVREWKELGFNLAMSFEFDVEINDKNEMMEILDECQVQGIKLIICDTRTHYRTYAKLGEEAFRIGALQAYEDFGRHPATFGFFAGDEPNKNYQDAMIGTFKVLLDIAPELTPFGNLYPFWTGSDYKRNMGGDSREFYYNLVDKMLKESKVPVIGYDRYTQCLQEGENIEGGIDMYFADLDMFHKVTKNNGISFFISLLSVGHWVHRVPTEDDIRWQIYTSLAHGARGIFWFFLYMRGVEDDYRNSPYETDFRKTEMYDIIARQQYIFNANFKEQFDKMEMTDVYHVFKIHEGTKRFYSDGIIEEVLARHEYPTILTYYEEYETKEKWVSVVNAHQRLSNNVTLVFSNGEQRRCWLAPGQIKLYKLSEIITKS